VDRQISGGSGFLENGTGTRKGLGHGARSKNENTEQRLVMVALSICCLAHVAQAQPTADQVLDGCGTLRRDKQNVMKGQFVNVSVGGVSDRDLSFAIAFLVKTPPETLAKQIAAGE
jgi:hypothetical protein